MSSSNPVVITCALTGGIHGKEANPNLPEQPDEIVAQGIDAVRAGAAVLHVHARRPDGGNTQDPEVFSEQVFFPNHRSDILRFAEEMVSRGVKPELEIYSSAMLEEVAFLLGQGILQPPYSLNFVLHTPTQGGERGTAANLVELLRRTRELLPVSWEELRITASSMGRTQLPITTIAMAMGLHARTGMEDNVMWAKGEPLRDNAQLVERTARIAKELGLRPATPDEARELLGTRGREPGSTPVAAATS